MQSVLRWEVGRRKMGYGREYRTVILQPLIINKTSVHMPLGHGLLTDLKNRSCSID